MPPLGLDDLAIAAVAGYAILGEGPMSTPSQHSGPFDENGTANIWPLREWVTNGGTVYRPVVSSGFGTERSDALDKDENGKPIIRKHAGVDIMFKRKSAVDQTDKWGVGTANGTKWFFTPEPFATTAPLNPGYKQCPVFAVADGIVWSASAQGRGFAVVLDHGKPWATFYHHLVNSTVPPTSRGAGSRLIRRGDLLGFVGGNPVQKTPLKHLHFEVWKGGAGDHAVDPEPMLARWSHHR